MNPVGMPLYQSFSFGHEPCMVAIWQIAEREDELVVPLPHAEALLDEARRRFKAPSRRSEWLAVRRLLHELGVASHIGYLPSGRPYLVDDARHLSISHTRGYAAVALHSGMPVGLDIEQRTDKVCRVQEKFLSHEEKIFLPSGKNNVEALLILWTAKEAMFKLVDRPGIDFADHFHLSPFRVADAGKCTARETFTPEHRTFCLHYWTLPDFVMSLSTISSCAEVAGGGRMK